MRDFKPIIILAIIAVASLVAWSLVVPVVIDTLQIVAALLGIYVGVRLLFRSTKVQDVNE